MKGNFHQPMTAQEREQMLVDLTKWGERQMSSADFMVKWAEKIEHDARTRL